MILFFVSFLMVFLTSYLITSLLARRGSEGVIYFLLIAFANIVLTFEVLSLFSAITPVWVLVANALVLAGAINCHRALDARSSLNIAHQVRNDMKRIWNTLKLDKYLLILAVGFAAVIGISLFLCYIMPVVNADASAYHVVRSVFWVTNHNLNHFITSDERNLYLPINSEILYAWVIMFTKKQLWLGFFSFAGYILSAVSVYNFMRLMRFSLRKTLWVIFILTSFGAVIVQLSGTETDIIIAGLISSSLFLFWLGVKENRTIPVFMSALAYALAIGTKTPAILAIPGTGFFMVALCAHYKNFKPLLKFLGFAAVNFLIFSSYNYILNYINYGNISGSKQFIMIHKNSYGLRAIPANFIKYLFLFFDFTGFHWGNMFGENITAVRDALLSHLGLADILDGAYTTPKSINQTLLEPLMGLGILGFIVYLPCWFRALIHPKRKFLFAFAIMLLINIAVMSYQLQFMTFSVRFLTAFCVISSPILVYSYCKKNNPYKFIILCFAMFYLLGVSTHLWPRPFKRIVNYLKSGYTVTEVRQIAICSGFYKAKGVVENLTGDVKKYNEECMLRNKIMTKIGKDKKILYFSNNGSNILAIKMLTLDGYKIDFGLMEDLGSPEDSDVIITIDDFQLSSYIRHYEERKNDLYMNSSGRILYYRKNADNPCFYLDSHTHPLTDVNNSKQIPYMSNCMLEKSFFKNHGFEEFESFDYVNTQGLETPTTTTYYFYKRKR